MALVFVFVKNSIYRSRKLRVERCVTLGHFMCARSFGVIVVVPDYLGRGAPVPLSFQLLTLFYPDQFFYADHETVLVLTS